MSETDKGGFRLWRRVKARKGSAAPVSIRPDLHRSLKRLLSLLVGLSSGMVFIENGLNPILLLLIPLIVAALVRRDYRQAFVASEFILTVIFVCYVMLLTVATFGLRLGIPIPQFLAYFTFGIVAIRALGPLNDRNLAQLIFLSLGLVLINCVLTNHVIFGVLLPIYFFVFMGTLLQFHRAKHSAREITTIAGSGQEQPHGRWQFSLAKYVVAMVLLAAFMFIVLPRPYTVFPAFRAAMASGASLGDLAKQISYGDMLGMGGRNRIAFLVRFHDKPPSSPPYWRGRALDATDGVRWFMSRPLRLGDTFYRPQSEPETLYRIMPVRLQSRNIYVYGLPTAVYERNGRPVPINAMGEVVIDSPLLYSDAYTVYAVDKPIPLESFHNSRTLDSTAVPKKIGQLAVQWAQGAKTPKEIAEAMVKRFRNDFKYKLDPPGAPADAHPLEHFLFETRTGNCQHFAGALALMLRAVRIPSRVVEGFYGMEKTDSPDEFVVRFAGAHVWVEAMLDGKQWTRLDPTPPRPDLQTPGFLQKLGDLYDKAEYKWIRVVVNFDRSDQRRLMRRLYRLLSGKSPLGSLLSSGAASVMPVLIVALGVVAALAIFLRKRLLGTNDLSGVYLDTMRALVKKGVLNEVHAWHETNVQHIEKRAPQARAPLARFMNAYLAGRFHAGAHISRADLQTMRGELLDTIERR